MKKEKKIIKKIVTLLAVITVLLSTAPTSVSALEIKEIDQSALPARLIEPIKYDPSLEPTMLNRNSMEGNTQSYMNYVDQWACFEYDESLPEKVKDQILNARCELVYGSTAPGWTINNMAYITYPDGTIEELPEYNDLFPYWDKQQLYDYYYADATTMADTEAARWSNKTIPVYNGSNTNDFGSFRAITSAYNLNLESLTSISNCTIGVRDITMGKDIGSYPNCRVGATVALRYLFDNDLYGMRASTYASNSGKGTFVLYYR